MNEYQKLKIALRYWLLGKQFYTAVDALEFGDEHHTGLRKDGVTPEYEHQIRIAHYLRTLHASFIFPEETFAAVVLHDVVEDHPVALDVIYRRFGSTIGLAVDLLTKTKGKTLEEYYRMMEDNPIASIAKGGDRIHNHSTMMGVFNAQKQLKYIDETNTLIIPMLRNARRRFPQQECAYENIKHVLRSQIDLIVKIHDDGVNNP